MNYLHIYRADITNGPYFRVSLFVSGCARHCPGCFNQESWNPESGKLFDENAKKKIFEELEHPWCHGLSLLGGEPLSYLSDNRKQVLALCKEVKEKFPDKNIWLWTGYVIEELMEISTCKKILKYVDVLIDGPFIEEKKDLNLLWRGSSNQRIIDVKQYLKNNDAKFNIFLVVLHHLKKLFSLFFIFNPMRFAK